MDKKDYPTKWIRLRDLDVAWAQAQRGLKEGKVERIAENFDPDGVGLITVCEVPDSSKYHVIDGQHRVEALKVVLGDPDQRVQCEIIKGVAGPEDAARVWLARNLEHSRPQALEAFIVKVTAGDEEAVAIKEIIDASGFAIGARGIQAISACTSIYRKHGEPGLTWVLDVLHDTWGYGPKPVAGELLRGFGGFYSLFNGAADPSRVAQQVARRYTPTSLLGAAKAGKVVLDGGTTESIIRLLVKTYNFRLSEPRQLSMVP